jgi:3,4-dihydroxy 2-butanone 4-phosphate synthase/GTP cyclohydrolase II
VESPETPTFEFDSIDTALADLKAGRALVVVDDEARENEGDLISAAQFATPDMINFMAVEARGLICLALTGERLDALDLPLMVTKNTDSNQTAFTVSIDAAPHLGVSTGISLKTVLGQSRWRSTQRLNRVTCAVRVTFFPSALEREES